MLVSSTNKSLRFLESESPREDSNDGVSRHIVTKRSRIRRSPSRSVLDDLLSKTQAKVLLKMSNAYVYIHTHTCFPFIVSFGIIHYEWPLDCVVSIDTSIAQVLACLTQCPEINTSFSVIEVLRYVSFKSYRHSLIDLIVLHVRAAKMTL